MTGTLDHIGIAVTSLDNGLPTFVEGLGFRCEETETVASERVRVAVLFSGSTRVELLEPTSEESPISAFLKKRGEGVHHLAFSVLDIESEVERMRAKGILFIEPAPRPGAQGTRVAFLHPKSAGGVLTELVERKGGSDCL